MHLVATGKIRHSQARLSIVWAPSPWSERYFLGVSHALRIACVAIRVRYPLSKPAYVLHLARVSNREPGGQFVLYMHIG